MAACRSVGDAAIVLEAAEHALDCVSAFIEWAREAAFQRLFALEGMLGTAPWRSIRSQIALVSYALSASTMVRGARSSSRTSPARQSATLPPVSRKRGGRPSPSVSAWSLLLRPPRLIPIAWASAPLFPRPPSGAPSYACYRSGLRRAAPPAAASVTNISCQMPLAAHRTKRL